MLFFWTFFSSKKFEKVSDFQKTIKQHNFFES